MKTSTKLIVGLAIIVLLSQSAWIFSRIVGNRFMHELEMLSKSPDGATEGTVDYPAEIKKLMEKVERGGAIVAAFGIFSFFLAVLTGIAVIRSVLKPIRNIFDNIEKFGSGDFVLKPGGSRENEFRILGEKLAEANKSAMDAKLAVEIANRSKYEFLTNMSHEIRTPMNHIVGFTELMLDGNPKDLNETQKEYLSEILDGGKHLLDLIDRILELAKTETDNPDLNPENIHLKKIVEESMLLIREKTMRHGIRMISDIADNVPDMVNADKRVLKRVLFNLLSNAAKFTPDGGTIRIGMWMGEGAFVEVSIADSGIGLSEKEMDSVFTPFNQTEGGICHVGRGIGLGLSMTKKFVDLLGGSVIVESGGEGKGSVFRFTMPVARTV